MPPKAGKGAAPEHPADAEQQRLQARAFDQGMLSRTRRVSANSLPPTKQMAKADGKDIVKRTSTRRNRYMLVFNCQIAPAAAGKLGTLTQLDSRHPVMYIDFPEGRLKLLGTLTFPRNKYMVLKLGTKEVLCEDVLESMIVFSESWWVGKAEDNPEGKKLPLPDWMAEARRHDKYEFSSRGAKDDGAMDAAAAELDDVVEEAEEPPSQSQRPQRAAARGMRGKRQRYNEDSDTEEHEDEMESGSEGEAAPRKLPKLQPGNQQKAAGAAAGQRKQRQQQQEQPIGGEGPAAPKAAGNKLGTLDAFLTKPAAVAGSSKAGAEAAAAPKPAAKPAAKPKSTAKSAPKPTGGKCKAAQQRRQQSEESEDVVDLAGSSSDEEEGRGGGASARGAPPPPQPEELSQPPSSSRPQRAAAGAAAKRLRIESDSEDDEEGSEGGGSGGAGSEEGREDSVGQGSDHPSDDDASEGGPSDDALESQEESEYSPSE